MNHLPQSVAESVLSEKKQARYETILHELNKKKHDGSGMA